MHPSSFYNLRARYAYTPLYGPYSLSEALEGLVFYSLDESQDSISIGSKRTLRHELISELSNVVDDLQDYLVYFSSAFLICPSDSLDFCKELRAGCDGFEPLTVYWGAIITRLAIARKIVERNFWPHLFRPTIHNPATVQGLGRSQSPILPNASSKKSSASIPASGFITSSYVESTPHSSYCPSKSQRLPLNVQNDSKCPQTMSSKTNPTGGEDDHASSSSLDTTPTPSVLRETGNLKNNTEALKIEATGEPVSVPSRTSSPSTALQTSSLASFTSNPTLKLQRGSSLSPPCSFANAISRPSTSPLSAGQRAQHLVPPPFHSLSTTQNPPSLHLYPSTPFLSKQRCSSLPPTSRQLEGRLLRTQPSIPMDKGSHSSPPISPSNVIGYMSNTSSPMHDVPPISPAPSRDMCQYPAPLHPTVFPTTPTLSPSALTMRSSDSVSFDDPKGWKDGEFGEGENLKNEARVAGIDRKADREIEVVMGEQGSPSELVVVPARTSPLSTASWSTSTAPYISNPPLNLCRGSSYPHSFDNTVPRPPTSLCPEKQHAQHSISVVPSPYRQSTGNVDDQLLSCSFGISPLYTVSRPTSTTQKRSPESQMRCSPVNSLSIPPFQQQQRSVDSYPTYPPSDDISVPPNRAVAPQHVYSSTLTRTSETRESSNWEDNAEAWRTDEQITEEMERVVEGEEVAEVLGASSHSLQLTPIHGQLITASARKRRLKFNSTHPALDAFQHHEDEQSSHKGPSLSIMDDNASNTSFLMHNAPPIPSPAPSHNLCKCEVALHPYPDTRGEQIQLEALQLPDVSTVDNEGPPSSPTRNSHLIPFPTTPSASPSILWGPVLSPQTQIYGGRLGEAFTPRTGNVAAQCLGSSTSTHVNGVREPMNGEARVAGIDEQSTEEVEAVGEEEDVVEVEVTGGCIGTMLAKTSPPTTVSQPTSTIRASATASPSSMASQPISITREPAKASPSSTGSQLTSTVEKTRGSPPRNPNSEDYMQLGQGESRDRMSWSRSGESNEGACSSSSGSRASSCGLQTPISCNRGFSGRVRASSSPAPHYTASNDLHGSLFPIGSPQTSDGRPCPRPHSRNQSQPTNNLGHDEPGYSSLDDDDQNLNGSHSDPGAYVDPMSSLLTRENENKDDSNSDLKDSTLDLVTGCLMTSSAVSSGPLGGLDVLQRAKMDLYRKCMDSEPLKSPQPCDLYRYLGSLHLRPPTPFPSFRWLKNFCGQPLLGLQLSVSMVDKGHSQLAPSQSPSSPLAFHDIPPVPRGARVSQALMLADSEATLFYSNVSRGVDGNEGLTNELQETGVVAHGTDTTVMDDLTSDSDTESSMLITPANIIPSPSTLLTQISLLASSPCPGYQEPLTRSSPLTNYTTISGCSSMSPVFHSCPPELLANPSLALEQLRIFNDAQKQHWLSNSKTKIARAVKEVAQGIQVTG